MCLSESTNIPMKYRYDYDNHRWVRREGKTPCVDLISYKYKIRGEYDPTSIVRCFSILPPLSAAAQGKSPKKEYPWVNAAKEDDIIRRRQLVSKGGILRVRFHADGGPDFGPELYDRDFVVQPLTVVDEMASPIITGDHSEWNPFEHYVYRLASTDAIIPWKYYTRFYAPDHDDWYNANHTATITDPFLNVGWNAGSVGDYRSCLNDLPPFHTYVRGFRNFIPKPTNHSELTARALNAMLPRVRAETEGVNSLYELKDFSSLPHTLSRIAQTAGKLLTLQYGLLRKSAGILGYTGFLKQGASDFLEWKFNVAPFISDVRAVLRDLTRLKTQVMRNLEGANRVRRRHYSYVFDEYDRYSEASTSYRVFINPDEMICTGYRNVYTDPTKFHAEIEYLYYYSSFQEEFALLLSYLDSLGVNLNPAIVWRAIPYTWMIDFVFSIGRYLDRLRLRNMEPTLRVDRYCWSVLRRRKVDVRYARVSSYPIGSGVQGITVLPSISETAYGRWVEYPDITSYDLLNGVNASEFTLLTALALTKLRRKGHKSSALTRNLSREAAKADLRAQIELLRLRKRQAVYGPQGLSAPAR